MPYVQKSFLWLQRKAMWSKEAALGILSPFHPARGHPFSRSVMSNSLWPHGLQPARTLCPWDFPGKNTGAISFSKGSSPPLNRSHIPHIGWRVLYYWGTWQAQSIPFVSLQNLKKASLLWTLPGFQRLQQWSELEGMLLLGSQPWLPVAPVKLLPGASVHTPLPSSDRWVWNIAMALALF